MSQIKTRYSKQRETIYHVLLEDETHPNVDTIYMKVKEQIPDISLGTVYRNLNLLAEQKRITRLDIGDGNVHYDAQMIPHYHFVCDQCGKIYDLHIDSAHLSSLINKIQTSYHHQIDNSEVLFHGTCEECLKKS